MKMPNPLGHPKHSPPSSTLAESSPAGYSGPERRLVLVDRRIESDDRRTPERTLSDSSPRRSVERAGRRATDPRI